MINSHRKPLEGMGGLEIEIMVVNCTQAYSSFMLQYQQNADGAINNTLPWGVIINTLRQTHIFLTRKWEAFELSRPKNQTCHFG